MQDLLLVQPGLRKWEGTKPMLICRTGYSTESTIRFRSHKFCCTMDISRMYHRVKNFESSWDFLRFFALIRDPKTQEIKIDFFRSKTLIFGLNCAPYIAQWIVRTHAQKYLGTEYDKASRTILTNAYLYGYKEGGCKERKCSKLHMSLCKIFMKHEDCKFGDNCKYYHPKKLRVQGQNKNLTPNQTVKQGDLAYAQVAVSPYQPKSQISEQSAFLGQNQVIQQPVIGLASQFQQPLREQGNQTQNIFLADRVSHGESQRVILATLLWPWKSDWEPVVGRFLLGWWAGHPVCETLERKH